MAKKKGGSKGKAKKTKSGSTKNKSSKKKQNVQKQSEKTDANTPAPTVKAEETNPYDSFQNKRRHNPVLGQRHVRGEKKNLAKTRAASAKTRTEGILRDALMTGRKSTFQDQRFRGADDGMDPAMQRFVKMRQKQSRTSYNLSSNQVDELTVGGKSLSNLKDEELEEGGGKSDDEYPDVEASGLDDVVAKSKQAKVEAAREKREAEEKLGEFDADFSDLMGQLNFKPPKAMAPLGEKEAPDDYDKMYRQFGLERRVQASDRVKRPEEIAREKADKLAELERHRVARAEGIDIDEDGKVQGDGDDDDEGDRGASGTEDEGSASQGASDSDDEGEEEDKSGDEGEEEEDDGVGEDDDDDRAGEGCPDLLSVEEAAAIEITVNGEGEDGLPFALDCPSSARATAELLDGRAPTTVLKLVQRIRACSASSLGNNKKHKLKAFLISLLEYVLRSMAREDGDLSIKGAQIAHALRTPLVELAMEYPDDACSFFMSRLEEMGTVRVPKAADFSCLKLIALIFPVTDAYHPVCTPAAILADHWASNLANLEDNIGELISEGTMMFGIMYEFCLSAKRFGSSFFRLGASLLKSCCSSAGAGRAECLEVASAIAALLSKALTDFADENATSASVVAGLLVREVAENLPSAAGKTNADAFASLSALAQTCASIGTKELTPLALFTKGPAQIKVLDPVFHEVGDRPEKGMDLSETKQLQRKLTKERRAASRQLARDAQVLQQLQNKKESDRRVKTAMEKKRVNRMMEEEKVVVKELMSATTGGGAGMDTSLKRYSSKKEAKQANRRMGGNNTAANPTPVKQAKAEKQVAGAPANKKVKGKKKMKS